jgi:hypothetical protein
MLNIHQKLLSMWQYTRIELIQVLRRVSLLPHGMLLAHRTTLGRYEGFNPA